VLIKNGEVSIRDSVALERAAARERLRAACWKKSKHLLQNDPGRRQKERVPEI